VDKIQMKNKKAEGGGMPIGAIMGIVGAVVAFVVILGIMNMMRGTTEDSGIPLGIEPDLAEYDVCNGGTCFAGYCDDSTIFFDLNCVTISKTVSEAKDYCLFLGTAANDDGTYNKNNQANQWLEIQINDMEDIEEDYGIDRFLIQVNVPELIGGRVRLKFKNQAVGTGELMMVGVNPGLNEIVGDITLVKDGFDIIIEQRPTGYKKEIEWGGKSKMKEILIGIRPVGSPNKCVYRLPIKVK
jgi:hypothetical protein